MSPGAAMLPSTGTKLLQLRQVLIDGFPEEHREELVRLPSDLPARGFPDQRLLSSLR
jgi:hypothetical protein